MDNNLSYNEILLKESDEDLFNKKFFDMWKEYDKARNKTTGIKPLKQIELLKIIEDNKQLSIIKNNNNKILFLYLDLLKSVNHQAVIIKKQNDLIKDILLKYEENNLINKGEILEQIELFK